MNPQDLQKQIYSLEAAIEYKEQEIKEYQEIIALLLITLEKELSHDPEKAIVSGSLTALARRENISLAESFQERWI